MKKIDHLSIDSPVRASASQIAEGSIVIKGPCIYSIHDIDGVCAYVGRTNNIRTRLKAHKNGHNKKQPRIKDIFLSCDPLVDVYGPLATDRLIVDRGTETLVYRGFVVKKPSTPDREWLVGGEAVHCQILHPYLNRKLGYLHELDWLLTIGCNELYPSYVYRSMIRFGIREPLFSEEMTIAFDKAGINEDGRNDLLIEYASDSEAVQN